MGDSKDAVLLSMPYDYDAERRTLIVPDVSYQGRWAALQVRRGAKQLAGAEERLMALKLPSGVRLVQPDGAARTRVQDDGMFAAAWGHALERIESACEAADIMLLRERDLSSGGMDDGYVLLYRDDALQGLCSLGDAEQADTSFERVPLGSTPGGTFSVKQGYSSFNVNGSKGDKYNGTSNWIALWKSETGNTNARCTATGSASIRYNSLIYGGHVVHNAGDMDPKYGVDDLVFILPICNAHNNVSNTREMRAAFDTTGLWLRNYHQ